MKNIMKLKFKTIDDYADGRNNNYDFIRFVAASMVLFSHCYPLSSGVKLEDPLARGTHFINFGALGVYIFFMISGFLVTKSYEGRNNIIDFFKARILRIFPGLIVATLFSVIIIGGFSTNLPLGAYFKNLDTYRYIFHNTLLYKISYYLPGVFTNNPYPVAVNGSLWTLPVEFKMYILVGIVGLAGMFRKKGYFNAFAIVALALYMGLLLNGVDLIDPVNKKMIIYFILGAVVCINRKHIPLHPAILPVLWVAVAIFSKSMLLNFVFTFALTYSVFFLAYYPVINLRSFGKYGDFSYGMYIYAFPMQQLLASRIHGIGPFAMLPIAFVLTLICSILSWKFIEKPMLSLKNKSIKIMINKAGISV